jgi:hypothetical protein
MAGRLVNMIGDVNYYEATFNPTHWMPLPEPPRDYADPAVPGGDSGMREE